ncbi:alpha/beta fold hydrolase [Rurimicrobium arvi]|uniref:Alpha/beta fold hydrolase n=2 Tax=Rurimicrobium arvi TaxID=2049916 RepID=A0ABP8MVS9_9BACT
MGMKDHHIKTNHIQLHYIEYPAPGKPKLLMLHGITANAHAFDGVIRAGLGDDFHIYSPDLRGRGESDKPAFGYSMEEHARDIIGLLDHLGIEKAVLCGHSFGGLLSAYLSANFPERVAALILLDAAHELNPNAARMLLPTFSRLGVLYPSFDVYLRMMKKAPQNTFWDEAMESYYRADVHIDKNGITQTNSNLANITAMAVGLTSMPWATIFEHIHQPAILLNALGIYTMEQALLPANLAKKATKLIENCEYAVIDGNHQTMLYGKGAREIVAAIRVFYKKVKHLVPEDKTVPANG